MPNTSEHVTRPSSATNTVRAALDGAHTLSLCAGGRP